MLAELNQFYGSEQFYRHALARTFIYTEGMQYVAKEASAYWLLDLIAFNQHKLKGQKFQSWKMTVKDNKAKIEVTDGNYNVIFKKNISYTDFPLEKFAFYVVFNGEGITAMLPTEY
jgi:hypothetical protein